MGAILLNGSQIGEYSIIGAGSVVTQGTVIPPYSVAIGVPAKVVRKLKEGETKLIDDNAEEYLKHTRRLLKL